MNAFAQRHSLLVVHVLILLVLSIGLVERAGLVHMPDLALYFFTLLAGYAVAVRLGPQTRVVPALPKLPLVPFIRVVLVLQVMLMIIHWAFLGGIPLWQALHESDDLLIVSIRSAVGGDVPLWVNYGSHFMLKAIVPVALLLAWSNTRHLFWALAGVASLYAVSLLAKSYVVTLFVPLWIAFLLRKRWPAFVVLTTVFLALTTSLAWAQNPQKFQRTPSVASAPETATDKGVQEHGLVGDALFSIARRMVLMPGWTVAAWFEHIPRDIPFVEGGAVRPLAVVLGVPYVELPRTIYDLEYPAMAAKHVPGTMGTASFMYGYANFGRWGLFGAGIITALVLVSVQRVFRDRWRWAVVLNVFPLLSLSGSVLPTVLLTHGWALTILLFLLVRPAGEPAA